MRSQKNGSSRLVDGKSFFAHQGVAVATARSFEIEDLGDGIIGFTLTEPSEPAAAEPEPRRPRSPKRP